MSYGGYQGHQESVEVAKQAIGECQEMCAALTDRLESAMGAVIMAVGQNPNIESSQNAMNFVGKAKDDVDSIFNILNSAIAELDRYGGGF